MCTPSGGEGDLAQPEPKEEKPAPKEQDPGGLPALHVGLDPGFTSARPQELSPQK